MEEIFTNMHHFLYQANKEFKKHLFDYVLFVIAGISLLISLNIFKGDRLIQFVLLLIFMSFYVIWGVYHHVRKDSVHLRTMIEYILIGFTVLFLVKILLMP